MILARKFVFLCRVVRKFEGAIEQPAKINRFAYRLSGCRGLSRLEEIPPPDFDWRKLDNLRDAVHVPLQRKNRLRRTKAAKRAMRRSIRGYGFRVDADVGPIVRAAGVNGTA